MTAGQGRAVAEPSIYNLPDFGTRPPGPVATLEPVDRPGGTCWYLRAGYEHAEGRPPARIRTAGVLLDDIWDGHLAIFGTEWAGYRAATPAEAQTAADTAVTAYGWRRSGPWQHGRLLDPADGARPEVWQATVERQAASGRPA